MSGSLVHLLCPIDPVPTGKRVKQIPASTETRSEISEGQGCIQLVQGEISGREALLSQFAAKYVNRVVSAGRGLGERQPRHEDGSRFANVCGRHSCVREGRLAQRVLLQRDLYRLLKRKRGGLRCWLSRGCLQEAQYGDGSWDEFDESFQPWTPAAGMTTGFIHSVFSSTSLVGCVKACRLLHHGPHGAVLLFGETDGFLHGRHINSVPGDHVVNPHCRKHLRRTVRLVGLDSHFIACNLLVMFLPQHGNDIECRATGQPCGN